MEVPAPEVPPPELPGGGSEVQEGQGTLLGRPHGGHRPVGEDLLQAQKQEGEQGPPLGFRVPLGAQKPVPDVGGDGPGVRRVGVNDRVGVPAAGSAAGGFGIETGRQLAGPEDLGQLGLGVVGGVDGRVPVEPLEGGRQRVAEGQCLVAGAGGRQDDPGGRRAGPEPLGILRLEGRRQQLVHQVVPDHVGGENDLDPVLGEPVLPVGCEGPGTDPRVEKEHVQGVFLLLLEELPAEPLDARQRGGVDGHGGEVGRPVGFPVQAPVVLPPGDDLGVREDAVAGVPAPPGIPAGHGDPDAQPRQRQGHLVARPGVRPRDEGRLSPQPVAVGPPLAPAGFPVPVAVATPVQVLEAEGPAGLPVRVEAGQHPDTDREDAEDGPPEPEPRRDRCRQQGGEEDRQENPHAEERRRRRRRHRRVQRRHGICV